jgi:hypothetical protein
MLSPLPEDPKEADDPQAEGAAPGDEATDAPMAPRPAQVAGRGAARALRLLRHSRQQHCLDRFRLQVMKACRRVLLRRSQRPKLSWERFNAILKVFPIPNGHVRDWRHQMA